MSLLDSMNYTTINMHKKHAYTNHQNGFKNTPNGIKIDQSDSNPQKCLFTSLWLSSKTRFGSFCLDKLPPTQHLTVLFLQMLRWFNWSERTLKEIRQTETHQKNGQWNFRLHTTELIMYVELYDSHNSITKSSPISFIFHCSPGPWQGSHCSWSRERPRSLPKRDPWDPCGKAGGLRFFFPEIRGMWTWKCL